MDPSNQTCAVIEDDHVDQQSILQQTIRGTEFMPNIKSIL
jgi:hypothetical protein